MKCVLCVPDKNQSDEGRAIYEHSVAQFAEIVDADLVIFPESYLRNYKLSDAMNGVKKISENIRKAVLAGVSANEGYELAIFWNPNSIPGETLEHLYIKHSSANRLAFEHIGYKGKNDMMFNPIILCGKKIGVMICHDMFFPLITHNLVKNGAEILINLTGGNVKFQKWNNVIRGRSLEIGGAFLCTMGHSNKESGKSSCIVYECGRKVPFFVKQNGKTVERLKGPEPPGFAMVNVPCKNFIPDSEGDKNLFSDKYYSDIVVMFGNSNRADLEIIKINDKIIISSYGKLLNPDADAWIRIHKSGVVGLLVLPLEELKNRIAILKRRPQYYVDYHLVLYYGNKSDLTNSELLALAKLRAIENRMGILILTNDMREALKTNNYKDIQRFKEQHGAFGFNKNNLNGLEGVFSVGIPESLKNNYLNLL